MAYVYRVRRRSPAAVAVIPSDPPVVAAVEPEAPVEAPAELIPATAAVEVAKPKRKRAAPKRRGKKSDG